MDGVTLQCNHNNLETEVKNYEQRMLSLYYNGLNLKMPRILNSFKICIPIKRNPDYIGCIFEKTTHTLFSFISLGFENLEPLCVFYKCFLIT